MNNRTTTCFGVLIPAVFSLLAGCIQVPTQQPPPEIQVRAAPPPPIQPAPEPVAVVERPVEKPKVEVNIQPSPEIHTIPVASAVAPENAEIWHETIWDRLRHNPMISFDANNPRVQQERLRYTGKPGYLKLVTRRAEPYLHHISEQLQQHGLPQELLALPIIESAYNTRAISKHGAAGLWQFIRTTGKRYGLEQNSWYDARHDVLRSTQAAIEYLSHLVNEYNGDWLLALASYNAGETTVRKAIERNLRKGRPGNYWHLQLPDETMSYVPRFLAVVSILMQPEYYAIELWDVPNTPYFDSITVEARTSINKLSRGMKTDRQLIKTMNAAYLKGITPPKKLSSILIPIHASDMQTDSAGEAFAVNHSSLPRHHVRAGETLSYIARLYGVDIQDIKSTNQLADNELRVGQMLTIPES